MNVPEVRLSNLYAKAFFCTYAQNISFADYHELQKAEQFFLQNSQLFFITKLPRKFSNIQHKFLNLFYEKTELRKTLEPIIKLLLLHQRLFLLPLVIKKICAYYEFDKNIEIFNVTSSHKLSEKEAIIIRKFLEKNSKKDVLIKMKIDNTLIAGIRLQSPFLLWEYSIANHVHAIKKDLLYEY